MDFKQAVISCFSKYVTFSGRAPRSEYWYFALFNFIVGCALLAISAKLNSCFSVLVFLPGLAVMIRRLHDKNRSGWWCLLAFIPLIGTIILLYWFCTKGTTGDNRYGPDPLAS